MSAPVNRRHVALPHTDLKLRMRWVAGVMLAVGCIWVARAVNLQVVQKEFLQEQGEERFLRTVEIKASRGMVTDRNGEPLAISTPVESIWANPPVVLAQRGRIPELAAALEVDARELETRLQARAKREFVYLRRRMPPSEAQRVLDLKIDGVNSQREYRRYYPAGELTAHVLGYTNIDDHGQEGLELAFDSWLAGKPGAKRVIRDRRGRVVETVELVKEAEQGRELRLTLDRRLQHLAARELRSAVAEHRAQSGSVVIIEVATGEVLAMVNYPSYNPNAGRGARPGSRRNRAVTDVIEPGSVAKPFTVAAGLESGKFTTTTRIDTTSGYMKVGRYTVRDIHNYGMVDLTRLLTKSSNVGAARIAAQLEDEHLYDMFHRFGFGEATGSGFPGEVSGVLPAADGWSDIEKATLSFGYGLSVTPLQLAQAYAAFGNEGRLVQATFIAGQGDAGHAVLDPEIARTLLTMLESVTAPGGTATRAAVPNFRVAGKTGTSHKNSRGGYHEKRYISVFAGLVPASKPRFAGVVIINDPAGAAYYGGAVAAPVFGKIMPDALRLLNVPPDDLQLVSTTPSASTMVLAVAPHALPPGIDADASAEGLPP